MSAVETELSFAAMFDANEHETPRWQHWLERPPTELLDVPQASPWRKRPANSRCPSLRWNFAMPSGSPVRRLSTTNPPLGAARVNFARREGARTVSPLSFSRDRRGPCQRHRVSDAAFRCAARPRVQNVSPWLHRAQLASVLRKKGHGTD